MYDYDLVVIGSGPGGQKAAIAAAKLGKRVAVVERRDMIGGVCVNTGTIPSKTLREAVLYLTGLSQRELYGASYRVKEEITIADLLARTQHVIEPRDRRHPQPAAAQPRRPPRRHRPLRRPAHRQRATAPIRGDHNTVTAEKIVIATGTQPARPSHVEFDDERVLDSDSILQIQQVPDSMVVVGAGVIGIEYASMFAALGTKVTVVEKRAAMLDFCDPEIVEALKFHLRDLAVTFRFGEEVDEVEVTAARHGHHPGQRQADPRRHGDVLGRPAGRHRRPRPGEGRAGGRQPRPDQGRRALPDRGRRTSTPSAT